MSSELEAASAIWRVSFTSSFLYSASQEFWIYSASPCLSFLQLGTLPQGISPRGFPDYCPAVPTRSMSGLGIPLQPDFISLRVDR